MAGAQKIAIERVVKDAEIKVRLSWEESHDLLRLLTMAQNWFNEVELEDANVWKGDRERLRFAEDLRSVIEQAMQGEANTREV